MGVYKRKDSDKWWISYSIAGKLYREPGGTKAQATALLAKRKAEIFEGQHFPDKQQSGLTMDGLRTLWLERAAHKKSIADDRQRFGTIVEHFGPSTLVASLLPADVERFRSSLMASKTRRGLPPATATVNRHLALLRAALKLAAANHYLHRNPMGGVKLLAENNVRERICSPDEYKKLIENAHPALRLAIVMGAHTGMRLGEIAGLTWADIDLAEGVFRLAAGKTKTGKGRNVPITPDVRSELLAQPRRLDGRMSSVDKRTLSSAFNRLWAKLGIENLRFHDLRHTAATNLRRAGADIFTIAAITGHTDLASLRRYNTVTVDDMREAMARVGQKPLA